MLVLTLTAFSLAAPPPGLSFEVVEGKTQNRFYRQGDIAAHALATSGDRPRLVVAFPAGNTGIGIWFEGPLNLVIAGPLKPHREGARWGVRFEVQATETPRIREAVLSSVRVLRDYVHTGEVPDAVRATATVTGRTRKWVRDRVDGAARYELSWEPLDASGGRIRVTALISEKPLRPIPMSELLNERAGGDPVARQALAFLSYDEKLLAGSWRFLTYFGRDTLLSLRLLMPALKPRAIEAALGSVLDRLGPGGRVAHEEDIGEKAALRKSDRPIFDYKMIDDDFLLAPVLAAWALDSADGRGRIGPLLAKRGRSDALRRNLEFVLDRAARFAEAPRARHLIALLPGAQVGEWRDSHEGLGGGRVPFNVNASLVPAALDAAARLYSSPLLSDPKAAATARRYREVWEKHAPPIFRVRLDPAPAGRRVEAFARELKVPNATPGPVDFYALALDGEHRPIPVMHTDDGFRLLFNAPPADELDRIASRLIRPFPAGLRTPVGMVVANAAYVTDPVLRGLFSNRHYHGAVVWSWQQAMLAAGLERQLERTDLPAETRSNLKAAQKELWTVIAAAGDLRTSELWTWTFDNDRYRITPFGGQGHATESNAAQLWSTVYLAVRPAK